MICPLCEKKVDIRCMKIEKYHHVAHASCSCIEVKSTGSTKALAKKVLLERFNELADRNMNFKAWQQEQVVEHERKEPILAKYATRWKRARLYNQETD